MSILYIGLTLLNTPIPVQATTKQLNQLSKEYPDELMLKIGKNLFVERKQGCATCHGINGKGNKRSKNVNLQRPSSWKSKIIASNINCLIENSIGMNSVAIALILNGANNWNEKFYTQLKLNNLTNKIFFDKEMIGINSSSYKRNVKSIIRILRKYKFKIERKNIPKLMANSVYFYISKNIFLEDIVPNKFLLKCDQQ